jgi:hypothetical protein
MGIQHCKSPSAFQLFTGGQGDYIPPNRGNSAYKPSVLRQRKAIQKPKRFKITTSIEA